MIDKSMTKTKGGGPGGNGTSEAFQQLGQRCGNIGRIESNRLFSTPSAPIPSKSIAPGFRVRLTGFSDGHIIPDGWHTVSKINDDGSFHVGGNTAVWPVRVAETEGLNLYRDDKEGR